MSEKYYCLVSSLPEISLNNDKLSLSREDLFDLLYHDLSAKDYLLVESIYYEDLNREIINYLFKKEYNFNELKYNEENIEEFLITPSKLLPKYLYKFFTEFKENDNPEEQTTIKRLSELYFFEMTNSKNKFLQEWFIMEQRIRNILTAITCRNYNISISEEVIGSDNISNSLKENKSKDFGLSGEVEYIDKLLAISEEKNLLQREKMVDNLKLTILEDILFFDSFTIEAVLGFVLKFKLVNRWLKLDAKTGKEMFEKVLKEVQQSFELPETYKL